MTGVRFTRHPTDEVEDVPVTFSFDEEAEDYQELTPEEAQTILMVEIAQALRGIEASLATIAGKTDRAR